MSGPRIGGLFEGYGGLTSAVREVVGGELVWYSEIDPGALRILAHHHPDVPNLGDITAVDWSAVPPVDVLTLGFPCQDISSAGKQAGIRPGTRSGLWTHAAYAIGQLRPRLVVIENVRNLVSAPAHSDVEPCAFCLGDDTAGALRALGAVLGDLADLGFDAEWHGLPASAVGAPHERWREFIAAWPAGQPWDEWYRDAGAAADAAGSGGGLVESWGIAPRPEEGALLEEGRPTGRGGGVHPGSTLLPTPVRGDADRASTHYERGNPTLIGALLPTPAVNDMGEGKTIEAWDTWTAEMKAKHGNGNGHGPSLAIEAQRLLPTPGAVDGGGGPKRVRSDGRTETDHGPALRDLAPTLLPTPTVMDYAGSGGNPHTTGTHGTTLTDATVRQPDRWGKYAAAIERWEYVTRAAPSPTQPGGKGQPQLAPVFSEWMMGLPPGHVTDPAIWDGMTDKRGKPASASAKRNAQLRAIGNGVLPLQAAMALRVCLARALGVAA